MTDEDRYKEFEQYLTSREPGVDEVHVIALWLSACWMSTDLGCHNFSLNKPWFFFETSHSHKQPEF